jgi:hypothetical protein
VLRDTVRIQRALRSLYLTPITRGFTGLTLHGASDGSFRTRPLRIRLLQRAIGSSVPASPFPYRAAAALATLSSARLPFLE